MVLAAISWKSLGSIILSFKFIVWYYSKQQMCDFIGPCALLWCKHSFQITSPHSRLIMPPYILLKLVKHITLASPITTLKQKLSLMRNSGVTFSRYPLPQRTENFPSWRKIPPQTIQELYDNIPRRIKVVQEEKEGPY